MIIYNSLNILRKFKDNLQMNNLSSQDIKRLVLVVDDEFVNREMLGFIIRRDYNVIYAKNGKEYCTKRA